MAEQAPPLHPAFVVLLGAGYATALLDRGNIAFAELQMGADLHLSASDFGLASGLFFLPYCALQLPTTRLLPLLGAHRVLGGCLVAWGVASVATAATGSLGQLCAARVLLGAFEAGYLPGAVFYLSQCYRPGEVAAPTAVLQGLGFVGYAMGSLGSGALMQGLEGVGGVRGWRWLFVAQGVPALLVGIFVLQFLPLPPGTRPGKQMRGASLFHLTRSSRPLAPAYRTPPPLSQGDVEAEGRPATRVVDRRPLLPPSTATSSAAPNDEQVDERGEGVTGAHATMSNPAGEHDGSGIATNSGRGIARGVANSAGERSAMSSSSSADGSPLRELVTTAGRPLTWIFVMHHLCVATLGYMSMFFMPQQMRELVGDSWNLTQVGALNAAPSLFYPMAMALSARWCDAPSTAPARTRRQVLAVWIASCAGGACVLCASTLMLLSASSRFTPADRFPYSLGTILLIVIGYIFTVSAAGPFWALHHAVQPGRLRAVSVALVNSLGNVGGFVGPMALGALHDRLGPRCPADAPECVSQWGWGTAILSTTTLAILVTVVMAAVKLIYVRADIMPLNQW